ncbi:MAG: ester cyclase [Candidatus Kariarchaeaceae archaeon]
MNNVVDRNIETARQYYKIVEGKVEIDVLDEILHKDFQNEFIETPSFPYSRITKEDYKKLVRIYLTGMSPITIEIRRLLADEQLVMISTELKARHSGDWFGITPTNKELSFRAHQNMTMKNGKILSIDYVYDSLKVFTDIGGAVMQGGDTERIGNYLNTLQKIGLIPEA